MDDLAVARGGLEADRVGAFEDDDLMPGQRQRARRRQPDDPGADHDRFDLIHRWVHRPASQDWEQAGHLGRNLFPRKGARPGSRKFPDRREFFACRRGYSNSACGEKGLQGTAARRAGTRNAPNRERGGPNTEDAGKCPTMPLVPRLRPLRTHPATGLRQFCRRSADAGHPTIFAGIIRCAAANGPCLTHSECRTWPETDFPEAPRRCQSRH